MTYQELYKNIINKKSFLCVGLDSDINKIPKHLLTSEDPLFEFNRAIVDATAPYTVAYKPNLAFFEAEGVKGVASFERIVSYIKQNHRDILIIADAKRGDIGNTSQMYARAFFEAMDVDAVTLSPYMGLDTAKPFLSYEGRWAVLLALTSNPSAEDFEMLKLENGRRLYEQVIETSKHWGTIDNTMYVVGATKADMLQSIRSIIPDHFLLVPGVGAQGGSLKEVAEYGMNSHCGLLVNSSRAIIYADKTEKFAQVAAEKASETQQEMARYLETV